MIQYNRIWYNIIEYETIVTWSYINIYYINMNSSFFPRCSSPTPQKKENGRTSFGASSSRRRVADVPSVSKVWVTYPPAEKCHPTGNGKWTQLEDVWTLLKNGGIFQPMFTGIVSVQSKCQAAEPSAFEMSNCYMAWYHHLWENSHQLNHPWLGCSSMVLKKKRRFLAGP